jgi:hypothetical protein
MSRESYDHGEVVVRVLAHLARYPGGLSEYEISRALGYSPDRSRQNGHKAGVALWQLHRRGLAAFTWVPHHGAAGRKRVWAPVPAGTMAGFPARFS